MSAGLACLAPVFWKARAPGRAIAWVVTAGFPGSLAALVITSLRYGLQRAYFLEVALISVVWLTVIVGAPLIAILFRRLSSGAEAPAFPPAPPTPFVTAGQTTR